MPRAFTASCLFTFLPLLLASHAAVLGAPAAPTPVGPYSPAVDTGSLVFLSGQIAIDPVTGKLDKNQSIEAQTKQVWSNITAVLETRCLDLGDVVQAQVYLVNIEDFAAMNIAYAAAIGEARPARTTVAVAALPLGAGIEITVVAARRPDRDCKFPGA